MKIRMILLALTIMAIAEFTFAHSAVEWDGTRQLRKVAKYIKDG